MHGTSFVASLTDGDAPEHRTQQYFETLGNRAMYKDGWWLAMKTERIPWVLTPDATCSRTPPVSGIRTQTRPSSTYLPDDFTQAQGPCRRASRQGAGAEGSLLGGGGAIQGAAAARDAVDVLRHPAADPDRGRRSSSAVTSRT